MSNLRISLAAAAALLTAACGGGNGPSTLPGSASSSSGGGPAQLPDPATAPALKTTLAAKFGVVDFPIGAAIDADATTGSTAALLIKHFNSITAENVMKPDTIWPHAQGDESLPAPSPNFVPADALTNFAATNGMKVRGHTLVWHQTVPTWMIAGDTSNPAAYRIQVQQHLHDYIFAVVRHFPDIYAWDVVNEAATDTPNAANPYRTDSPWYIAYSLGGMNGSDYVKDAFTYASQARASLNKNSGQMKLILNDYNTELPGKRANVMAIVQQLLTAGVPIDGVGHQFHLQIDADVAQVTAALQAVEAISPNLVNQVTELDVSIYGDPGTCFTARTIPPCLADLGANPPQTVLSKQATLYRALFNAFNRPSVTSVTTWGIADNHTWLDFFPVTRTNRPLLFDTAEKPKWAFWAVVDPAIVVP